MANVLTIEAVYDDLATQLEHGTSALISPRNLPSTRLWTLIADTLGWDPASPVTRIVLRPTGPQTPVRLSGVAGNQLTITGKVELLALSLATTITVTVQNGDPDIAFVLAPPASWTLGQSFPTFDNRSFNEWCSQLTGVQLAFQSAGKTPDTALTLAATLLYSGIYAVINSLYAGQTSEAFTAPLAFADGLPSLTARIPVVHSATGAITVGMVSLNLPCFLARLVNLPDDDDPGKRVPTSTVGIGWTLDSQNTAVDDFEIVGIITENRNTLWVTGGYPKNDNSLSFVDIVQAIYGTGFNPPTLPGALQFLATDVGLRHFSLGLRLASPPVFQSAQIHIGTKPTSPGWVIIGPASDPMLALQEVHFSYANISRAGRSTNRFELGGTFKIGTLLFSADASYQWSGANYTIAGRGELVPADGLPLRLADLISGFGAPSIAAVFNDFLDLSFSEIAAEIEYASQGGTTTTTWMASALADLKLKLFGQEFLGLHNTTIAVSGMQTGSGPVSYSIFARGDMFILGAILPARLVLSGSTKTFTVGPVSFTLGDIITWMVNIIHPSWNFTLPEPWNVLNSIGFQNLTLEFDFDKQTVSLDTGLSADFGFISLSSLRLTYHKRTPANGKQGVVFAMKGKFLGLPIEVTTDDPDMKPGEMGWDLVNSKPIPVPGAGDQLFDLEYLGIGQHVSFRNTRDLKTVGEVITALENNLKPLTSADGNPLANQTGLVFAESSGWLLGTKFSLLSTATISAIFNDPQLYGLRIALEGEKAQSLSGLEFEILYKRISDSIGVFHIDLRLPEAIRQLEFGEVSVTIPEFVLDIYTNGNFKIDVGFPQNLDFSRSFAVQVFPFVGFGGFYFGYLNGTTSDRVPAISNGSFNPVLEFGLGLSIGVGKTIEKGMLRAGATLTLEGIVEGVLAWFNPDDTHAETALFWSISGVVGIDGHVFGSIDFKIIKASVDLHASARVSLTVECYQPIHIALNVNVSARVSIKIIFVTISMSVSFDLSLEYTVGHATTPPWIIDPNQSRQQLGLSQRRHQIVPNEFARLRSTSARRTLRARRAPLLNMALARQARAAGGPSIVIPLQFRPFFTQSDQPSLANTTPTTIPARSVALLYTATSGTGPDLAFARLAELCLQRVVNAAIANNPPQTAGRVSLYDLAVIKHQLGEGLHDAAFSYAALVADFLAAGMVFDISTSGQTADVSGTFFPMLPPLTLTDTLTDSSGQSQQFVSVNYMTDPRFQIDDTYEDLVDRYFQIFQPGKTSGVEAAASGQTNAAPTGAGGTTESTAEFVFRDYFLMITRQMVQSAIDYLDAYPYTTPGGGAVSLATIATALSAPLDLHDESPTPLSIALANLARSDILDHAGVSAATITGAFHQANVGDALQDIASRFGVSPTLLAATANPVYGATNAAAPGMVNAGISLDCGDIAYECGANSMTLDLLALFFSVTPASIESDPHNARIDFDTPFPPGTLVHVPAAHYILQPTDTLQSVADLLHTTLAILVTRNAGLKTLLTPLGVWAIPPFQHVWQSGDSLQSIAATYAMPIAALLTAGYADAAIIASGVTLTVPYRPDIPASDLVSAMGGPDVTGPVAASLSRFMMHGLRLPQISPLTFDSMKAFTNTLGQQIDVPSSLVTGTGYSYDLTLTASALAGWFRLNGNGQSLSGTYHYTPGDLAELAVYNAPFAPAALTVNQLPLMAYAPNRYPLRQVIHWQCPTGLQPVSGQPGSGNGEPTIWTFPSTLLTQLATTRQSALFFDIAVGRQETPNAPPVYQPVAEFAFATSLKLGLKQVKSGGVAVPNDYLITSIDDASRQSLYALWTYIADPACKDPADIYLTCRADPATQGGRGVISQTLDRQATAVLKANLSTTNNPTSIQAKSLRAPKTTPGFAASLSDGANFLRLIWEAVTVNSGGFYLNVTEEGTGNGLPDDVFDINGIGEIGIVVIFASQRHAAGSATKPPAMLDFCNAALLSDHLDLVHAELVVESASFAITAGTTLSAVATAMGFAGLPDFVAANQDLKGLLIPGLAISVGTGTTVRTGDSIASVAARASVQPVAVANSLSSDTRALVPGALCQYAPRQLRLVSTAGSGVVGLEVLRDDPDPNNVAYSQLSNGSKLELMFNLLGVDLKANSWFQPYAMTTGAGVAAGRASEWPAAGPLSADSTAPSSGRWRYAKLLPAYEFAVAASNAAVDAPKLPPASQNPYAGIAPSSVIEVDVFFQDNFGNRPAGTTASGHLAIPVGYRDRIQPLSAWPGVAMSYRVLPLSPQPSPLVEKVTLELDAGFRISSYVAGSGQGVAEARKRIAADQEKLTQIYYQIIQPDYQVSVSTTLDSAGETSATSLPKSAFVDIVNAGLLFFGALLETRAVTANVKTGDTLASLDTTWLITDPGAILKANAALALGAVFDLASVQSKLSLPVTILARAGQSLTNLATAASSAFGAAVTQLQLATTNASLPLKAGTAVVTPTRLVPGTGAPAIGDQSLAAVARAVMSPATALAVANRTDKTILRPGTQLSYSGVSLTIRSGDSLDDLVTAFEGIPVASLQESFVSLVARRGISLGTLAFANETATGLLVTGATFTYPDRTGGRQSISVQAGDSLYSLATRLTNEMKTAALSVESLITENATTPGLMQPGAVFSTGLGHVGLEALASGIAEVEKLFQPNARLSTGFYTLQPSDSLTSVVAAFARVSPGYSLAQFVTANSLTGDLMPDGARLLAGVKAVTVDPTASLSDFTDAHGLTMADLGSFNASVPLAGSASLLIPDRIAAGTLSYGAVQLRSATTLAAIAALFTRTTAADIARLNADMWRTLTPGLAVRLNGRTVMTAAEMTFSDLWIASGGATPIDFTALSAAIDAASAFRPGAVLVGPVPTVTAATQKPDSLAAAFGVDAGDVLTANRALQGLLAAGTTVGFPGAAGKVPLTVRPLETINSFERLAQSTPGLENLPPALFLQALASTDGLLSLNAAFVLPPALEAITAVINRQFPDHLFPVSLGVGFARVNFKVTTATITALASVPDITPAEANRLLAMAAAGDLYIDGDRFNAALASAFAGLADPDYLISMTRRFASLPTERLDPSFTGVPEALSVTSSIPAHSNPAPNADVAQSLRPFARDFEAAFNNAVKLAVSAAASTDQPQQRQLWAVDFSAAGYGFAVDGSKPSYFARQPISNALLSADDVPMRVYVPGEPTPVVEPAVDIRQADLDIWAQQFFAAMDLALSPECAVVIHAHDPAVFDRLVAVKGKLADRVGSRVGPLINNGHTGDLSLARAAYADRLKIQLSNAYRIETVLQFPVTVTNGGAEKPGFEAPRLFGQAANLTYVTSASETIASLAAALHVSAPYVVDVFADMPGILNLGADGRTPITVTLTATGATAQPESSDTLNTLARKLGLTGLIPAEGLINAITIAPAGAGLFGPGLSLNALEVAFAPQAATSIEAVALDLDVSVPQLASAMQDRPGLFNPSIPSLTWTPDNHPAVTVPLSASSTFATLAAAFAAGGVTDATGPAAVANYFRIEPPGLIAAGASVSIVELLPGTAFNATAVPLSSSGAALTFFLEVANPSRVRKLFMNLDFPINQIEHDIAPVAADPDYENSSWLSFLLPFDSAGGSTNSRIGRVEIPIPNDSYPDLPILTGQFGSFDVPPKTTSIADLKAWNYGYAFRYRAAAQDLVYTGVTVNRVAGVGAHPLMLLRSVYDGTPLTLLDALAQFNASQTALNGDLQQLPFLKKANSGNPALAAPPVLAEFAEKIEALWDKLPIPPPTPISDGAHRYKLATTRARGSVQSADHLDTLIMTGEDLTETLWPDRAEVEVDAGQWLPLTRITSHPTREVVFSYPKNQVPADATLTHRIWFDGLDVVVEQSARAGLHVTRNEDLSSEGPTLSPFIYQTPTVGTVDNLTPQIIRPDAFVLAPQPAPNQDLAHALSAFFMALFDIPAITWAQDTTRQLTLGCSYSYQLIPGSRPVNDLLMPSVPVILHPQYAFELNPKSGSPDYTVTAGSFVSNVASTVESWIAAHLGPKPTGILVFDLTLLAAGASSSPVLKLERLIWKLG